MRKSFWRICQAWTKIIFMRSGLHTTSRTLQAAAQYYLEEKQENVRNWGWEQREKWKKCVVGVDMRQWWGQPTPKHLLYIGLLRWQVSFQFYACKKFVTVGGSRGLDPLRSTAVDLQAATPRNILVNQADDTYLVIPVCNEREISNMEAWLRVNYSTLNQSKSLMSRTDTDTHVTSCHSLSVTDNACMEWIPLPTLSDRSMVFNECPPIRLYPGCYYSE